MTRRWIGTAAGLPVAMVVALFVAGCSSGSSRATPATDSAITNEQAAKLTTGSALWVAGTLTGKTSAQWCIRDDNATICAPPSVHLRAEQMPAAFLNGVTVRGRLTGGAPTSAWTAMVIRAG